jgi:hypothetical protein
MLGLRLREGLVWGEEPDPQWQAQRTLIPRTRHRESLKQHYTLQDAFGERID